MCSSDLIENTAKSVRRGETVDEAYWDFLFNEVKALYHLDETSASASGPADLGPLPQTAVILLGSLAAAWILILVWVVLSARKKRTGH